MEIECLSTIRIASKRIASIYHLNSNRRMIPQIKTRTKFYFSRSPACMKSMVKDKKVVARRKAGLKGP